MLALKPTTSKGLCDVGQINTYGSGRVTEAQRRVAKERAKEQAQIAEAERREALLAAGKGALDKVAIDLAIEAEQNVAPPDPAKLAAEAKEKRALRDADETRLAELLKEWNANRDAQYVGAEMMFDAIFRDMELGLEAMNLAAQLGINNPIQTTMMKIGGQLGIPQNRLNLMEIVFKTFINKYQGAGKIDQAYFESGP